MAFKNVIKKLTSKRTRAFGRKVIARAYHLLLPALIRIPRYESNTHRFDFPDPRSGLLEGCFSESQPGREKKEIPKIIWIYWHDKKDMPATVFACIERIKITFKGYNLRLLDRKDFHQYVQGLDFPSDIGNRQASNLLRLEALYREGGIWIDSSVIVYRGARDLIESASGYEDIIGFYSRNSTTYLKYPKVETWFLAAPQGAKFFIEWRNEYLKVLRKGEKSYIADLRKDEKNRDLMRGISEPQYFAVSVAMLVVFQSGIGFNGRLLLDEKSAFFIQYHERWRPDRIITRLTRKPAPDRDPILIKLTGGCRSLSERSIRSNWVNSSSIIGRLLKDL